jgi:NAD(P)-dependent dehydrogenase (short-subunit alcohol dehydrogenase family)
VADENESVNELTGSDATAPTSVITGANSGIGLAAAVALAQGGGVVALVGRDQGRLDAAVSQVRAAAAPTTTVTGYRADFGDLDQVRQLADTLAKEYPRIDLLANNAGLVMPRRVTTVDGHELVMQANHLAPFLLTSLLRERLAGGRVVNTASDAHRSGRLDPADLDSEARTYAGMAVYGSTKQANIQFAAEAARRWPDILSTSYHPGVVRTRFGRDSRLVGSFYKLGFFLRSPERGADTLVWLAQAPASVLTNGGYYYDRKLAKPTPPTADPARAAALWEASERAVGLA